MFIRPYQIFGEGKACPDDEVAEPEGRYRDMVSGTTKAHTREESMHLARKGRA